MKLTDDPVKRLLNEHYEYQEHLVVGLALLWMAYVIAPYNSVAFASLGAVSCGVGYLWLRSVETVARLRGYF